MCPLEEQFLSLSNTVLDGYLRILWKVFIAYNELMQLITEEVGTGGAAMTVVNGEETAPGPVLHLLKLGLDYVENDGDAILVVVSNDTLICVGSIPRDQSISLVRVFSILIIREALALS